MAGYDRVSGITEAIVVDAERAGALAPEYHAVFVTAEGSNVVSDPLDSRTLVKQPEVCGVETSGIGETEDVKAILNGDYDMGLRAFNPFSRDLVWNFCTAGLEAATIDPNEDWQPSRISFGISSTGVGSRRPHCQCKAIF